MYILTRHNDQWIPDNYYLPVGLSGKPSGLKYYWVITNQDPIFALPGTNTDRLRESIEEIDLDKVSENIARFYTDREAESVRNTLYQIRHFDLLADTESARRLFISSPESVTATMYHDSLVSLLTAYINDTTRLQQTIDELALINFSNINGLVSSAHVASSLRALTQSAQKRLEEEQRRFLCFEDYSFKNCAIPSESLPTPYTQTKEPVQIPSVVEQNAAILKSVYSEGLDYQMVALEPARCYPFATTTYFITYKDDAPPGSSLSAFRIQLANELWFHDLTHLLDISFYKELYDRGATYSFQPLNPYICLEYAYDRGMLRTATYLQQQLTLYPIFTQSLDKNKEYNKLRGLEQNIINTTSTVYAGHIEYFINATRDFLSHTDTYDLIELMGALNYTRARESIQIWDAQSAAFDTEVAALYYDTVISYAVASTNILPFEPLFLTRAFIPSFFQANNRTLHNSPVILTDKLEIPNLKEAGVLRRTTDLSNLSDEDVTKHILSSYNAYRDLLSWDLTLKQFLQPNND